MATKIPLGYIELENGSKEIYAMNDLFLNFTFEKEENWEEFRLMVNILLDEYRKENPTTVVTLIEGKIHLETQYKFYINTQNTTRNQDFKLDELEKNRFKYIELQNRAITEPPVPVRAIDYFVLGVGQSKGKIANQIWILASDVESVLQEETFTNYILKDEATNKVYPDTSGIMFISLTKLSKKKNLSGELALFLLGKLSIPESEEIKRIASTFNRSFEAFKDDKEVKNTMSIADKYRNEGWVDGKEEGIAEGRVEGRAEGRAEGVNAGASKIVELIKSGLSPDEALRKVNEECNLLATSMIQGTA